MNERILKLLAQTDIPQFPILGSLAWVATDHDMEKFAELIVRECCEVINAAKPGVNQLPAEVALDLTAKNVKEYFGVEL